MPEITQAAVTAYYQLYDKTFEAKYATLYKERHVRCLRMSGSGDVVFFYSVVWAEMRKITQYCVDIAIKHGTVHEAQCDCPVGQGPHGHCKHIAVTLNCLIDFMHHGDFIALETYTQTLVIWGSKSQKRKSHGSCQCALPMCPGSEPSESPWIL